MGPGRMHPRGERATRGARDEGARRRRRFRISLSTMRYRRRADADGGDPAAGRSSKLASSVRLAADACAYEVADAVKMQCTLWTRKP